VQPGDQGRQARPRQRGVFPHHDVDEGVEAREPIGFVHRRPDRFVRRVHSDAAFAANHTLTPADLALHGVMAGYWTRFAATGDPSGDGFPTWLEYRKNHDNYFVFDSAVSAGVDQRSEACEFWSPFFLRSMLGGVTAATP